MSFLGTVELLEKLKRKEIDGILISRPSYYFFVEQVLTKYPDLAKTFNSMEENLILTPKDYVDDGRLTLGMLVKSRGTYDYFRSYFEDNWLQLQVCLQFARSTKMIRYGVGNKGPDGSFKGVFIIILYAALCVVGIIVCYLVCSVLYGYVKRN